VLKIASDYGTRCKARMGAAFGTKKERVALREIARAFRLLMDAPQGRDRCFAPAPPKYPWR